MSRTELSRRQFLAKSIAGTAAFAGARLSASSAVGANERLRIGIIGAGSRGLHHLSEIVKLAQSLNVLSTWSFTGSGGGTDAITQLIPVQPEKDENHMANWIECIRTGRTPNAPIELGFNHSVACIMGYQALLSGRRMKYIRDERRIVPA